MEAPHLIVEVVKGKLVDWHTGRSGSLFQSLCGLCRLEALSAQGSGITVMCA